MAGPIWVKLSRFVEDGRENVLAKEFFGKMEIKKVRIFGQPCAYVMPCIGRVAMEGRDWQHYRQTKQAVTLPYVSIPKTGKKIGICQL